MTSPDVSLRGFVMFSASVLGWILWLSYALEFLFGAGMTGGWLLVGILFSVMVIGVILMLNALLTTMEGLQPEEMEVSWPLEKIVRREKPGTIRTALTPKSGDSRSISQEYRIALGLKPQVSVANRRRTRPFLAGRSLRLWGA
jgi:hypothetical protein